MFGWWKQRQRAKEREIFRFWDGTQERGVDPIATLRGLMSHPELKLEIHPQLAAQGDQDALDVVMRAVRQVMGVQSWDAKTGTGLTDMETLEVMLEFGNYIGDLKKNGSLTLTSPVVTAQRRSPTATATNARSACG